MMLTMYPAVFYEYADGKYDVVFPDLNHLATCGDSFEDAMAMAIDCLAGYAFTEKLDGHTLPAPTPFADFDPHCEDDGDEAENGIVRTFGSVVSVDVDEYARTHFSKPVKKTLAIPAWLNDMATRQNINFSKTLQAALMRELGIDKA